MVEVKPEGAGIGTVPLTPIMPRLLESCQISDSFHQSILLRVPANLGVDHLTNALQAVLDHHDVLRLKVEDWQPIVQDHVPAEGLVHRVEGFDPDQIQAAASRLNPAEGVMAQVV